MKNYISKTTGVPLSVLENMGWQDMVDEIILPKLAGGEDRGCIHDDFMTFMTEFANECIILDKENSTLLSVVLFHIAMQRLTRGGLKHQFYPVQMPKKYRAYSPSNGSPLTPACIKFICKGLPIAVSFAPCRDYALTQAWGLVEHLKPEGGFDNKFSLQCDDIIETNKVLYNVGLQIVEEWSSRMSLFNHFATTDQWHKHKKWLAAHLGTDFSWDLFYNRVCSKDTHWIRSRKERHIIKMEILSE